MSHTLNYVDNNMACNNMCDIREKDMKESSVSYCLFAMIVTVSLFISFDSLFAQYTTPGNVVSETSAKRIATEIEQIRNVGKALQENINHAQEILDKLSKDLIKENEPESMMNAAFTKIQQEIFYILDRLGSNSDLMDAVYHAREGAMVLQTWFKRQPSDYPRRDDIIKDLEAKIQDFDKVAEKIAESQRKVQNQLRDITMRYRFAIQNLKVGRIGEAQGDLKLVLGGLESLTQFLSEFASTIVSVQVGVAQ